MNVSREYTSDESDADDYIHIGTASGTCKKPLDILEWKYILIIGLLEKKNVHEDGKERGVKHKFLGILQEKIWEKPQTV